MNGESGREFDEALEFGSSVVGGATGAMIGLVIGGPIGALVGAAVTPGLESAAESIGSLVAQGVRNREIRACIVLNSAAERAGVSTDQLVKDLAENDAQLELALRAVKAGSETTLEESMAGLARVLAQCSTGPDSAEIDELAYIVSIFEQIGPPEVRILYFLQAEPPPRPSHHYLTGWRVDEILEQYPGYKSMIDVVLQRLSHLGLTQVDAITGGGIVGQEEAQDEEDAPADQDPMDNGPTVTLRISNLGRRLLDLLAN